MLAVILGDVSRGYDSTHCRYCLTGHIFTDTRRTANALLILRQGSILLLGYRGINTWLHRSLKRLSKKQWRRCYCWGSWLVSMRSLDMMSWFDDAIQRSTYVNWIWWDMHARHDVAWQVRSHDLPDKFETIGNGKRNAIHEAVCGHHDTWNPRDLVFFAFFRWVTLRRRLRQPWLKPKRRLPSNNVKPRWMAWDLGWSHGIDTFASLAFTFLSQGNAAIGVMQKLQGTGDVVCCWRFGWWCEREDRKNSLFWDHF